MSSRRSSVLVAMAIVFSTMLAAWKFAGAVDRGKQQPTRLAVVWTSGDPDVAHKMAFMYVHNSQKRGWFGENLVIVWGPSARLLAGDKELQSKVRAMIKDGVKVQACVTCADMYGVSQKLRDLDIDVKPMGQPLTKLLLDDGWNVLAL